MIGYIRWYDGLRDDGILADLSGNTYYFNSWSFPGTFYEVTGKSKRTGKQVTIHTRKFPGLFLKHVQIRDTEIWRLATDTPVTFKIADNVSAYPWAIKIKIEEKHLCKVLKTRVQEAQAALKTADSYTGRNQSWWVGYYADRIKTYSDKLEEHHSQEKISMICPKCKTRIPQGLSPKAARRAEVLKKKGLSLRSIETILFSEKLAGSGSLASLSRHFNPAKPKKKQTK